MYIKVWNNVSILFVNKNLYSKSPVNFIIDLLLIKKIIDGIVKQILIKTVINYIFL